MFAFTFTKISIHKQCTLTINYNMFNMEPSIHNNNILKHNLLILVKCTKKVIEETEKYSLIFCIIRISLQRLADTNYLNCLREPAEPTSILVSIAFLRKKREFKRHLK